MRIQFRRGSNPLASRVLAAGEPGYNTTTGEFRIGDGVSQWSALPSVDGVLPLASGNWRGIYGNSTATSTHAVNLERAQRIRLRPGTGLQNVGINIVTIGTAGAILRVGVRADANGLPGTLITEWGTIATDATTGIKTLPTTGFVTPANGAVWLTVCAQVASCQLTGLTGVPQTDYIDNTIITSAASALYQSGVTGALPAGFVIAGSLSSATSIAVQGV